MTAYDERGDVAILIEENEWLVGADQTQDFEAKPQWLRLASRHLPSPIIINGRDPFLVLRGSIQHAGTGWDIGNVHLSLRGAGYSFRGMGFFDVGFYFDSADGSIKIGSFDDPRDGKGSVVALEGAATRAEWASKTLAAYRRWSREDKASRN